EPDDPPGARQAVEFGGASVEMSADVHERYLGWFARWQEWAERERKDRLVRAVYGQLFSAYVTASGNPEELELVLGTGCLAWTPPGHEPVRRHLLTSPVAIHFDDDTGRLTVRQVESADTIDLELDMLDPGLVANPAHINEIRAEARVF